jgi:hypothetical protein
MDNDTEVRITVKQYSPKVSLEAEFAQAVPKNNLAGSIRVRCG